MANQHYTLPPQLTDAQLLHSTFSNMRKFGGSFVHSLSVAWVHADEGNRKKIEGAFPELLKRYHPNNFHVRPTTPEA